MKVEVVNAVHAPVSPALIRRALTRALRVPEVAARVRGAEATVAVRIVDDEEIRSLNSAYANEDHVTDVLSFEGEGDHLGDVALCWPQVVRQSKDHDAETRLLCVHALLHLLGWDHATAAQKKEMDRLTAAALREP